MNDYDPNEWVTPPEAASTESPEQTGRRRYGGAAKLVAPLVAALLVGAGAVVALGHNSGSSTASVGTPAAAVGTVQAGIPPAADDGGSVSGGTISADDGP